MTEQEFLTRYHTYGTPDLGAAMGECGRVNSEGIDGNAAAVVLLCGLYGLMLVTSAAAIGIVPVDRLSKQGEMT